MLTGLGLFYHKHQGLKSLLTFDSSETNRKNSSIWNKHNLSWDYVMVKNISLTGSSCIWWHEGNAPQGFFRLRTAAQRRGWGCGRRDNEIPYMQIVWPRKLFWFLSHLNNKTLGHISQRILRILITIKSELLRAGYRCSQQSFTSIIDGVLQVEHLNMRPIWADAV